LFKKSEINQQTKKTSQPLSEGANVILHPAGNGNHALQNLACCAGCPCQQKG
jgi:hypothetical protein